MRTLLLLLLFVSGFAYAQPPINNPTPYEVCDDNNDGIAPFFIHDKDAEIINGQPNLVVSYFLSLADAQANTNEITPNPFFNIIQSSQILYARVIDPADPNNPSFTTMNLVVNPLPNFFIPNTTVCSGTIAAVTAFNNAGIGNYNYAWTTPPGVPNPGNVDSFTTDVAGLYMLLVTNLTTSCSATFSTTVNFFPLVTPVFNIPTTACENSLTTLPTTSENGIYGTWSPAAMAVGTTTYEFTPNPDQCASNYSITITILPSPTANQAPNLVVVDNPYDGFATFDLTSNNAIINSGSGIQFQYFLTLANAQNNTNPITNPTAYLNTINTQPIYVSVFDPAGPNCTTITSFNLVVTNPNIVYIPDAHFKAKLITLGVDTNTDGEIQYTEASAIATPIDVSSSSITDITGFEAFTNVPSFRCVANNITSINLSNLPNLKSFDCGFNNNLTSLNLTNLVALDSLKTYNTNLSLLNVNNLTSLKHLDCSYNHITSLNVNNLTNLKIFNCASNWLTTIDVTPLTALEYLNCSMNQLATINVTPLINLKTLICSNNNINSLSLVNLPSLEHLEYGNNQSTSLTFSNLPNMKYLDCGGNSLVTLNASILPLLEYLDCSGNHLTSINVTGLTHLSYFTLALNQVASINVSGLSSLNYFNCSSNQLTTLNVSGLNNLTSLYASNNTISSTDLTNLPSLSLAYFDYNQLTSLDLTGSNNTSNVYCNNNLLTNLSIAGLANLSWLDCHENHLTTINFTGLSLLQTVLCDHNNLTSLDFSTCPMFQNLSCSYNALTNINIKNGFSYINTNNFWHENPNLTFVCGDDGELTTIGQILNQSINVNNGNVVFNSYCSFNPNGTYNTITGTVRYDFNNNGCDATDSPAQNIKIGITNWSTVGATFTNATGNYTFYTTLADQSITPELENPNYFNVTPLTTVVSFPNNNNLTQVHDFCITPNGNHPDLEVILQPLTNARPGFNSRYKLVLKNKGNVALSSWTGLTLTYNNNKMSFVSATITPATNNPGVLEFGYSLNPFESTSIELDFNINSPVATNPTHIGDVLAFTANIAIVGTDETPVDNTFTVNQTVVGSYDPNAITCLEGDTLPTSAIGEYLHYGITFENTGNYQAENVVVKDVIDTTKYDVNSIQLLTTSHPVYTRITGNVVEFIFENINLVAASGNPPVGGHGDVLFKIKSLPNLVSGDVAIKSANIYFDYNAPIDTNLAETTFSNLNSAIFQLDTNVSVAPNPTHGMINITSKFNIKSVELFDVQGRILETSFENNMTSKIDLSDKQNGIYFLKINTENGSKVEKIVKK